MVLPLFCVRLAQGGPLGPNADAHGGRHPSRQDFLRLVREQPAVERGLGADCAPLHRRGAHSATFKVRLSNHGYTFVAKGVEALQKAYLRHESVMYDKLRPIQGIHVLVCTVET